jgi:hypothetical protein
MCPCVWDLCETVTLCSCSEKVHEVDKKIFFSPPNSRCFSVTPASCLGEQYFVNSAGHTKPTHFLAQVRVSCIAAGGTCGGLCALRGWILTSFRWFALFFTLWHHFDFQCNVILALAPRCVSLLGSVPWHYTYFQTCKRICVLVFGAQKCLSKCNWNELWTSTWILYDFIRLC